MYNNPRKYELEGEEGVLNLGNPRDLPREIVKKMKFGLDNWADEEIENLKSMEHYLRLEKKDLEGMVDEKGLYQVLIDNFTIEELDMFGI